MKNFLLLMAVALGFVSQGSAVMLSPEQALSRLGNSDISKVASMAGEKGDGSGLKLDATVGNLYVFSGGEGFFVAPADDAAPALLAYSDSGTFDIGNPELAYWLDFYNSEIEWLQANDAPSVCRDVPRRVARKAIEPMLKTKWNQEEPYNMLCPKVDGRETVTGCVATAMAQVMKYHNYPAKGKGTHSYFWKPGEEELSFNYDDTPFQWDLMDDVYDSKSTEESRKAVAELMLGCGISVDMHYEPGGSGAATIQMDASLIDIFDYSPAIWMPNRVFYGYNEWEEMIYSDLAQGLPVLYSGAGTAGGHQFVCDGYSADGFFHFNWGWGGLSNGYFLLTALNPDNLGVGGGAGGFNSSQTAALGVRPPREGDRRVYVMYNTEGFLPAVDKAKEGEDFRCTGLFFNYSLSTLPDDSRLGMKIVSEEDGEVRYADGPGVGGFRTNDGRRDLQIVFPDLPDGAYVITPALHADGKWSEVRMPVGYASEVTAKVSGGVAYFESQAAATVAVSDVELPAIFYREREFPMPFTVENKSGQEYYGSVTPWLLDSEGKAVAKSNFRPLDVFAGDSERIGDYIGRFTPEKDMDFPAGDYRLVFRDEEGRNVSEPVDVKVEVMTEKTEIKISDFRLDGKNPVGDPAKVKFSFRIECLSGVYFDAPQVIIFPGDGGYELYHKSPERIYLEAGGSRDVTVDADLSDLEDGSYMALVYNAGVAMDGRIYFRIERDMTGIEEVSDDCLPSEVYGIDGVKHELPLSPGIYVIDGRKVLISI